jgi:GNAT superfamily N-acetyltransferase
LHAFALWDLEQYPERVRFASAVRGRETLGYLLLFPLGNGGTVVHWIGDPHTTSGLLDWLPPRPLIVLCSEGAGTEIERLRGPGIVKTVLAQIAPVGAPPPGGPQDEMVRRLTGDEWPMLQRFAAGQKDRIGVGYADIDPAREHVFAGFDHGQIVALARPAARLAHVWIVGGVYVEPDHRNQGWGRAVVRALMVESARAGAPCGLFVREEGAPARALYDKLGYRTVGRRTWIGAGMGTEP